MEPCPITLHLLEQLMRGEIAERESRRLISHLDQDCPRCGELFSRLDPGFQAALIHYCLARSRGNGLQPSPEVKERIRQSLALNFSRSPHPDSPAEAAVASLSSPRRWALPLAASLVLALGLTGVLIWKQKPALIPIEKGPSSIKEAGISLEFLVMNKTGSLEQPVEVSRGVNRAVCRPDSSLLFRYRLEQPARVYLVRVAERGEGQLIYPPPGASAEHHLAGIYDAGEGDQIFAYSLANLSGLQTLCAVAASETAPPPPQLVEQISRQIQQRQKQMDFSRYRDHGIDCFQIKVEPLP